MRTYIKMSKMERPIPLMEVIQHEQRLIRNKHNSSLLDPHMVKDVIDICMAIGLGDALNGVGMWHNSNNGSAYAQATLGPGATNLTTGIASANMDRSRVLAITGQTDSRMLHKESHQNMDVITMFKLITKWNWSIRNGDNVPEIVRRAFKIAQEEKAGTTHIELPQDVAKQQSTIKPIKKPPEEVLRSQPNKSLIEKAVRLILASFHVRRFVEKTGICSMNTFMAKG